MANSYIKAVLTVIAAALVTLVVQQALRPAEAGSVMGCGTARNPCAVINVIYERSAEEFRACSEVTLPCYGVRVAMPPR